VVFLTSNSALKGEISETARVKANKWSVSSACPLFQKCWFWKEFFFPLGILKKSLKSYSHGQNYWHPWSIWSKKGRPLIFH